MKYVAIACVLIPIIVNFKSGCWERDRHEALSILFVLGSIGIIISQYRTLLSIHSDGSDDYVKLAFYSFLFILVPVLNFKTTPTGLDGKKDNFDYLINGSIFFIFTLFAFYSIIKA